MLAYIIRRLLLIVPTLLGIMVVNFFVIQAAPGGPVEQLISQITGEGVDITERVTRSGGGETDVGAPTSAAAGGESSIASKYRWLGYQH